MHATISFFFLPIVNMNRVEHACIMWDSFSFKTLLEESSITPPDRYGDLRRTVDFAGKLLRMRSSDESSATDACL